ncbi:serine/threonine-protein kinase dbf2 [Linderina macrospora]|uniref:Serine/threonine-protein kinase dbf2 n=1 Tax=Linderina macrospora TaxID=4868 RepID=A0ACC1JGN4_9FUNG|nr:serine/threonine-protein kinase dbf2 [Linderina macrospora]
MDSSDRPWLAYPGSDGVMHTFESLSRSVSLTNTPPTPLHYDGRPTSSPANNSSNMSISSRPTSQLSMQSSNSAFLNAINPQIRRKIEAAQVYFLDYYVDHLAYLANRRARLEKFKDAIKSTPTTAQDAQRSWSAHCQNETGILRRRRNRTREREFDILAQIGQGGFGKVFLARKRDTGEVCALKKMGKQRLVRQNEVHHILTERDILRTSKSPWLVKLLYSFQDQHYLYLAMEFVPGGDLRSLLIQNEIFRWRIARFYIAEAIAAVAALHDFGYFHRDLKPENFLVDATGHLKLTDFGLSHGHLSRPTLEAMRERLDRVKDQEVVFHSSSEKRSFSRLTQVPTNSNRAFSSVGSPDYMAPEILLTSMALGRSPIALPLHQSSSLSVGSEDPFADAHTGYDFRTDYWSLGCILYEFLAGYSPFSGPDNDTVWVNVFHWARTFQRPDFESQEGEDNLTPESWDLINRLICDREVRMCSLNELSTHPLFHGMDLFHLRETGIPPFVPDLQSDAETKHFDDFNNPDDMAHYRDVNNRWEESGGADNVGVDPAAFIGFTYKHNRQARYI